MESKFLHHEECPKCGSRNNVAVYSNGGRHCFSADCDYHVNGETGEEIQVSTPSTLHMGGVVAERRGDTGVNTLDSTHGWCRS